MRFDLTKTGTAEVLLTSCEYPACSAHTFLLLEQGHQVLGAGR